MLTLHLFTGFTARGKFINASRHPLMIENSNQGDGNPLTRNNRSCNLAKGGEPCNR